jgi:circadian clock protein KaiC
MLAGVPGTGKTIMIQQICFAWARQQQEQRRLASNAESGDEADQEADSPGAGSARKKTTRKSTSPVPSKAIFFSTFSEPHDKLLEHISKLAFFDEALFVDDIRLLSLTSVMDEGLQKVGDLIVDTARHENAGLICIDGFRALEGLVESPDAVRRFLYRLSAQLNLLGVTTIIALERNLRESVSDGDLTIADTIIGLDHQSEGSRVYSRLEVWKVRGMQQLRGLHTYDITHKGLTIYPRFETLAPKMLGYSGAGPDDVRVDFGIPALEQMLGGGLPKGSTTLVAGSLGVGKTLLSLHFLMAGASRGEAGLFVGFYESPDQLFNKADRFGMDLRGAVHNGLITLLNFAPIQLEPDIVAGRIMQEVEIHSIQRMTFDGALEIDQACQFGNRSHDFLAALVTYFKDKNITSLYNYEISKVIGTELDLSNTPLSILAENLILLRQLESKNKFYRVISVLQMRDSVHDQQLREFIIQNDTGITILSEGLDENNQVSQISSGFEPAN